MSTFKGFSDEDLFHIKTNETNSISDITIEKKDNKRVNSKKKIKIDENATEVSPSPHTQSECMTENNLVEQPKSFLKTDQLNDETPTSIELNRNLDESELNQNKIRDAIIQRNLVELQLQQKLMEEQNRKRKEMLAKALADRTKQTTHEVLKLEKIKKELNKLEGQFTQDVAILRKKIDHACLSYAEAEKHYLKVEKEFLNAKINLQKEKEKKELLTEHLCALITHNEKRKAEKLETLMLQLAVNGHLDPSDNNNSDEPRIVDGVDERTGKIVEFETEMFT